MDRNAAKVLANWCLKTFPVGDLISPRQQVEKSFYVPKGTRARGARSSLAMLRPSDLFRNMNQGKALGPQLKLESKHCAKPLTPSPSPPIVFGTRFGGSGFYSTGTNLTIASLRRWELMFRGAKLNLLSAHAVARADIHSICA